MKKIFSFAMAALLVSGLASCSKEIDNAGGITDGESMVTFTVKSQKSNFVTYAIAEGEEWTVNTVDVYAFEGGNLLGTGKLAENTDYEVEKSGTTTTIRVKPSWLAPAAGKNVTFYFVGNDNGHIATVPSSEAAFKALVTKNLAVDGSDKAALITTPLLFSATQTVKLEGRKEIPVQLKRREARFDIVNKYDPASQLVINNITALNTNIAGYLFSTGSGATFTQKHSQAITVPTGAAWVQSQEGTPARDIWTANSVFYLYPTKLGTAAGETEIVINATMAGGQAADYTLADASKINIVANSRYKIILDPLSLTFIVSPVDYDEGGDLETVTGGDDTFSGFSVTPAGAIAGNFTDNIGTGTASVYKFDDNATGDLSVAVTSTYGSTYSVTYSIGDPNNVTFGAPSVSTTRTYAGQTTVDAYTIAVPTLKTDDAKAYSIRLEIFSPGGEAKETILFTRGTMTDEDLKEALSGNEELAEVVKDAIATTLNKPAADITPEDLETVTSLNVSGTNGPSSLDGIENLPNLTEIDATGNTNITEVDLSKNPELTNVNLKGTGVTELDLSENIALVTLDVSDAQLTGHIDLSNNTKMEYCRLNNNPDLISVDLGNNENLTLFATTTLNGHNNIESVNFMGCPNLETLGLGGSKISAVDFSQNTKLKVLLLDDMDNLTELNVSMLPELLQLHVKNTNIATIDLTQNAKLWGLVADGAAFTSFDISNCPITVLALMDMQNTLTVTVWKDFVLGNLTSYSTAGSNVTFQEIN